MNRRLRLIMLTGVGLSIVNPATAIAAPPSAPAITPDIPEEILQTEVITSGRSPIDNRPLTATEYAELQLEIDRLNETPPSVSRDVKNVIGYLKLRKFLKTVIPFIPLK